MAAGHGRPGGIAGSFLDDGEYGGVGVVGAIGQEHERTECRRLSGLQLGECSLQGVRIGPRREFYLREQV